MIFPFQGLQGLHRRYTRSRASMNSITYCAALKTAWRLASESLFFYLLVYSLSYAKNFVSTPQLPFPLLPPFPVPSLYCSIILIYCIAFPSCPATVPARALPPIGTLQLEHANIIIITIASRDKTSAYLQWVLQRRIDRTAG